MDYQLVQLQCFLFGVSRGFYLQPFHFGVALSGMFTGEGKQE